MPDLPIQDITHETADDQPHNNRQRHSSSGSRERNTGNEDDGLDALPEHGDEREHEHGVLLGEALQPAGAGGAHAGVHGGLEGLGELHAPLLLDLADAQQGDADDADDDGGDEGEGPFVVILVRLPGVAAYGVEGAYYAGGDDEADEESRGDAKPYLGFFNSSFVS